MSDRLSSWLSGKNAVHFIGIGGAGCAPLARIFHEKGFRVSGSDLEASSAVRALEKLGIPVHTGPHAAGNLPSAENLLLIHTSAADPGNPEIRAAEERGARILKRGEALALLAASYPKTISVSGSHGKTSVTAMIAHTLRELGEKPGYLVGGSVNGWESSGAAGAGTWFVTEGDESDGTHALLASGLGIVTNIEDDHVWSLGGIETLERNFRTFASRSERLLYWSGDIPDRLFGRIPGAVRLTEWHPDVFSPSVANALGDFQLQNMFLALRAMEILGFERKDLLPALERFPGVGRRMTGHLSTPALRIVEDYAHHPTELHASLAALRKLNPERRLAVIFQPHRSARLDRYFERFVQELSLADRVFVVPVFAAWCSDGKYTSDDLADAIGPRAESLHGSWEEMASRIGSGLKKGDTAAVIGAGDIRNLIPALMRTNAVQELAGRSSVRK